MPTCSSSTFKAVWSPNIAQFPNTKIPLQMLCVVLWPSDSTVNIFQDGDWPQYPLFSPTLVAVFLPINSCLKKTPTIINNCSQFTCHDFVDPPHILFRLVFSRPWLTLKLLAFLPKLAEVFSWPIGQGMHVVFGGRCLAGLLWSRSSDLSGWISFSLCKASGL